MRGKAYLYRHVRAQHTLMAQQIRANNLANVNTAGFRADFERVSAYALAGDGYQAG